MHACQTPTHSSAQHARAGLDDRAIKGPALLEADQGDAISGKISRDEAAAAVVAALSRPDAAYKTLELRQNEAADAAGKEMSEAAFTRLFLKLALGERVAGVCASVCACLCVCVGGCWCVVVAVVLTRLLQASSHRLGAPHSPLRTHTYTRTPHNQHTPHTDRNRWRVGLRPFPKAVPPPPPPSEDETKAILNDPRVQAVRQREQAAAQGQQQGQPEQQPEQQQQQQQPEAGVTQREKEKELVNASA
jgi:hypothetical protein